VADTETREEVEARKEAAAREEVPGAGTTNRTVTIIIVVIALLFLIGGLIVGKKEEEMTAPKPIPTNARALVVPTDDAARTVVVAPCGTDLADTTKDAENGKATPNSLRFEFAKGSGDRSVLIPDCTPTGGVSGSNAGLPSAAFVLAAGTRENQLSIPPLRAESQALVPNGGKARTVVLGPCTGLQGGSAGKPVPARTGGQSQDQVLEPEAGQGDVATAAQC
jgi:hypothetical protein